MTRYEGAEGPDSSYFGRRCLAVINSEKEGGYRIQNPTAPPEIEECLIFDFDDNVLMTRALPDSSN